MTHLEAGCGEHLHRAGRTAPVPLQKQNPRLRAESDPEGLIPFDLGRLTEGRRTMNRAPSPGSERTSTSPPCSEAMPVDDGQAKARTPPPGGGA